MSQVTSEAAEQACARVMTTLAIRNSMATGGLKVVGRVILARPESGETSQSMVLPHIVAIAEEFSRRVLINASLPQIDLTRKMNRDLWSSAASRAEGTWDGHIDAWKKWHGVALKECPQYPALSAYIVARNAIMHGLGQLTRMQTQRDGGVTAIAELKSVGIAMNGLRLVISPAVLKDCADTARGFIVWLDFEASARGLVE